LMPLPRAVGLWLPVTGWICWVFDQSLLAFACVSMSMVPPF
jgi:hypothetical protein